MNQEAIEKPAPSLLEEEPIDGGAITDLAFPTRLHEAKHRADTTRRLSFGLIIALVSTIAIHYVAVMVLELNGKHDASESLNRVFNSWLPVISGLAGSAVTYYFTRDR